MRSRVPVAKAQPAWNDGYTRGIPDVQQSKTISVQEPKYVNVYVNSNENIMKAGGLRIHKPAGARKSQTKMTHQPNLVGRLRPHQVGQKLVADPVKYTNVQGKFIVTRGGGQTVIQRSS